MFRWLRKRRRARLLAEPFPAAWQATLHRRVGLYAQLDTAERATLREQVRYFMAEKNWEGSRGLELTDEMRVVVAANACMLTLSMDADALNHARTIIIREGAYVPPQPRMAGGIAHTGQVASGTAYMNGPVVLSWSHILHDSHNAHDGRNVVLHEFAHQLDFTGGVVDGTPPLRKELYPAWRRIMTAEYNDLVEAAEHGRPTFLNPYGATNPAEFFAVATEYFFERPLAMREHHPELYQVLRAYYRQDTGARCARRE